MKKLEYRILTVILSAAFFIALPVIMRTGSGAAKLAGGKLSAFFSRGNISIAENTAEKMAVPPLPEGHREFTYKDLDHIFINGERYDFPLKYNELPEEFSLKLGDSKKDKYAEEKGIVRYDFSFYLYYNDLCWAWGYCYSDKNEYDPDNVEIDILMFISVEKNKYFPQVIVGGLDVYNTDPAAVDSAYGYGAEDYCCSSYCVKAADTKHEYLLRMLDDKVAVFGYYDATREESKSVTLTIDEYYLSEEYSPEADNENALMEYKPVPEKNGGLQLALENLTLYGKKIKLPCTVNSLLYSLKDTGAYISKLGYPDYLTEYDLFSCTGEISTDNGSFYILFHFSPGQGIGDARVTGISASGKSAENIEISGIDKDDPLKSDERYGVIYSEEDEKYRLTDYEYNNVIISNGDIEIYYWGENLTDARKDNSIY